MSQRKRSRQKRPSSAQPKRRKPPATGTASAGRSNVHGKQLDWSHFRTHRLPFILLILVTLIAYANAWPDNLIYDDRVFVENDRFSDFGLADMARFFTENLWAASGTDSSLYRPLLLVSIALEAWLFGDWMAGYHLATILLHVLATVLVYGFVRHLLMAWGSQPLQSSHIAILAAMVFGVHPIHTEVVNSVFNSSEIFASIGIVGGLWWFLRARESQPKNAWLGLGLIYLLVLLYRESGASLPALAVAMLWFTSTNPWKARLRQCLPVFWLLVPLGIYLVLRANALEAPVVIDKAVVAASTPEQVSEASILARYGVAFGPERLLPAVSLWFESLKIILWPHPLQIFYDSPRMSGWIALGLQLTLLAAAIVAYARKRPGLITGLAFFYIAILPSSRIIGEAHLLPMLSDRMLYLPSVGLAIALASGFRWLVQNIGPRPAVVAAMIVTIILTPLTWARNAEWADDILLFETDYRKLEIKDSMLNTLVAAHLREDNYQRAVEICDRHADFLELGLAVSTHCGSAYGHVGRYDDAEQAFFYVIDQVEFSVFAHVNLAMMYLHLGRRSEASEQFEFAIAKEKQPFLKEYHRALMLIQLYPTERARLLEARAHLERALQLQPQHIGSREELDLLNERLTPPDRYNN